MSKSGNLLINAEPPSTGERFEDIGSIGDIRIERIVSSALPDTGLQCQSHDEWVLLVAGAATLEVVDAQGQATEVALRPGDWRFIAAFAPHRVLATVSGTVWLALHAPPVAPAEAGG
jgi:cupin 2 domain-containing protein